MIPQFASQDQNGCCDIIHFYFKNNFSKQFYYAKVLFIQLLKTEEMLIQPCSYFNKKPFYSFTVLSTFIYLHK